MKVSVFKRSIRIGRPASEVFAWHERPGAFDRLAPPWQKIDVLARDEGVRDGARVSLRTRIGPVPVRWDVEHRDYVPGVRFRDVQLRGPFAHWEHLHRVEPVEDGRACVLTDEIAYRPPFGAAGWFAGGWIVRRELERLFNYRHALTKADIEGAARYISVRPMTFLVAGASGVVARTLIPLLLTQGHTVIRLVRRATRAADEVFWDPSSGRLDPQTLRGVDVIVNLAGAGIADLRWTKARMDVIRQSRVTATRALVHAFEGLKNERRRPFALISASATGFYGDRGHERVDEGSAGGGGFLAGVCREWEREALAAETLGLRVALLRTGVVLTPAGGALARMLPVFRAGLGGRAGSGRQWMSWISADDLAGAIYHAVLDTRCSGPVNAVSPNPVTNGEFSETLAAVLGRPAILPAPAPLLRAVFGKMASETLLASTRVVPRVLRESGYVFRHEKAEDALRHSLGCAPSGRP